MASIIWTPLRGICCGRWEGRSKGEEGAAAIAVQGAMRRGCGNSRGDAAAGKPGPLSLMVLRGCSAAAMHQHRLAGYIYPTVYTHS